ncbi:MAG TPA: hypothetical protein VFI65_28245 [Streptosporangiaceae bacterium]|nr:hypothetical protein [Streptosporangiaceae bacterium]
MSTENELMLSPLGILFEPLDVPPPVEEVDDDDEHAAAARLTAAARPTQPTPRMR